MEEILEIKDLDINRLTEDIQDLDEDLQAIELQRQEMEMRLDKLLSKTYQRQDHTDAGFLS